MDIAGWTLVAWVGVAAALLFFLKVCLTRLCTLSCEELSCLRGHTCGKGDA